MKCDLCLNVDSFKILASGSVNSQQKHTLICKSCGWIFKWPHESNEEYANYYDKMGGRASYDERSRATALRRSKQLYSLMGHYMNLSTGPLKMLDVGGGVGQIMQTFYEYGHEVDIVDIGLDAAISDGMEVYKEPFCSFRAKKQYDLIVMSHILEHVESPSSFLTHAGSMLKKNGLIFVEVPFELYTPILKSKLGDPAHVGYFSVPTLKAFVRKTGFDTKIISRGMGIYNTRKVMVIRAVLYQKKSLEEKATGGTSKYGAVFRCYLEMLHPYQLYLVLRYLLKPLI